MPNWCRNALIVQKEHVSAVKEALLKAKDGKTEVDFNILFPCPEFIKRTRSSGYDAEDIYLFLSENLTLSLEETMKKGISQMLFASKKSPIAMELGWKDGAIAREEEEAKANGTFKDIPSIISIDGMPYRGKTLEKLEADTRKLAEKAKTVENEKTDYDEIGYGISIVNGQRLVENLMTYGSMNWYDWACVNWGTKWNASDTDVKDEEDGSCIISFYTAWGPPMPIFARIAEKADFDVELSIENDGWYTFSYKDHQYVEGKSGSWFDDYEEDGEEDPADADTETTVQTAN